MTNIDGADHTGETKTNLPGNPARIALISGMILTLELAYIRQIPSEVKAISYFTNLLLMASFLGIGLGCILHRVRGLSATVPAGLLASGLFVLLSRGVVIYDDSSQIHFWLTQLPEAAKAFNVPLLPAAMFIFACTATTFIGLGQALVRAMSPHPRLVAYGWDILGSLAGTVVFVLSSRLGVPPWVWAVVCALLWAALFSRTAVLRLVTIGAGLLYLVFLWSPLSHVWSPYYLIQHSSNERMTLVWVNSAFHQAMLNFAGKPGERADVIERMTTKFSIPYEVYAKLHEGRKPTKVLILGAGTGNDVNIALHNGVSEVVAVEIDPEILALGKRMNATAPYSDPRVRSVVDDARHFMHSTDEKFDMVVFGTLDSQTLLSGVSNLRLDNFVYTVESFEDAKKLLNQGGMTTTYYSVMKDWLLDRIFSTMYAVHGEQTWMQVLDDTTLFNTIVLGGNGLEGLKSTPEVYKTFGAGLSSHDDWPFVFLEKRTIAPIYVNILLVLVCVIGAIFLVLKKVEGGRGLRANFLFLGIGFTLVESSALVRLSLAFGTTWVVNAVVFSSVLAAIYLTNLCVMRRLAPSLGVAWVGLFTTLLINYFFPVQWLLGLGVASRVAASALLIGLPVVFSAVCFSRLFDMEREPGYALGVNLIGAMAGGFLEWGSMVAGLRAIWLLAVLVYLLAFIFTGRETREGMWRRS